MEPKQTRESLTVERQQGQGQVTSLALYVPVTRINEEERVVEGIAFANEVVEGEGGLRLSRTSMKAATPDYLRWGAVREMHQPSAVGRALSVEWQESGAAVLRVKVVDDQAWSKVKQGVYQGFSVGVLPKLIRGGTVEQCTWVETSLVDRPKDPGAVFLAFRADGLDAALGDVARASDSQADWIRQLEADLALARKERDEALVKAAEVQPPVRYPAALARVGGAGTALHEELRTLTNPDPNLNFEQQLARLDRIAEIKRQLCG